jgi:hypothetical protein
MDKDRGKNMDKDMDKEKDKQSILFPILPTSL